MSEGQKPNFIRLTCNPVLIEWNCYFASAIGLSPVLGMIPVTILIKRTIKNSNRRANKKCRAIRKPLLILTAVLFLEGLTVVPYTVYLMMNYHLKSRLTQETLNFFYFTGLYCIGINLCGHSATFLITNKELQRFIMRGFKVARTPQKM